MEKLDQARFVVNEPTSFVNMHSNTFFGQLS